MKKKITAFLMSFLMCFSMIGASPVSSVYAEEPTETPTAEVTTTSEEELIDADVVYQEDLDAYGLVFDEVNSQVFNRVIYTDGSDYFIFAHSGNSPNAWYVYSEGQWYFVGESTVTATDSYTEITNDTPTTNNTPATTVPAQADTVTTNYGETLVQLDNGEFVLEADDFSDASKHNLFSLFALASTANAKIDKIEYIGAYTGTAPFDNNDDPGNDSRADNDIVRSYDKVYYRTSYSASVDQEGASVTTGSYHFEAFLPVDPSIAEWDLQTMKWLQNAEVENITGGQLLTGDVNFSGGQLAPRIGVINWVITVKGATQGTQIHEPEFSMWINEEEPKDCAGSVVKVSAFPSYDAQVKFEGKNADGTMYWSLGLALHASQPGKGIRGQQIPVSTSTATVDVTFSHQQSLLDYKLNNNIDAGKNGIIPSTVFGIQNPFDDGSIQKTIDATTVYNGGTVTATDNGDHTATFKITGFEFSPEALTDGVIKNASASEASGASYDDDTYMFASVFFETSAAINLASVDVVKTTIDSELTGSQLNSKDNAPGNNVDSLIIEGPGTTFTGPANYGPQQTYFFTKGNYNNLTNEIEWDNSNSFANAYDNPQSQWPSAGGTFLESAPGNYFGFETETYVEPKYGNAPYYGPKDIDIFYKLDGDVYEPVPGYTFGAVNDSWINGSTPSGERDLTPFTVQKKFVVKKDGSNWTSDDELKTARFNSGAFEFYDSAEEVLASGKKLVGFYVQIQNMPRITCSELYYRAVVEYPVVQIKQDAVIDSTTNLLYSPDNENLVAVATSDLYVTMQNGTVANELTTTGTVNNTSQAQAGDSVNTFAKPTYDVNGNLASGGTWTTNWQPNVGVFYRAFSPRCSGVFVHLKTYNTYINQNIVNKVDGTSEKKTTFNLDDSQREVTFEIESGTYSPSQDIQIDNDPISVSVTIPKGLNPLNPSSASVEEKWGVGYAGIATQDTSTNGGAGIIWTDASDDITNTQQWKDAMEATKNWTSAPGAYTITETRDSNQNIVLTWQFTNFPIGYALPNIHYAGLIGTSEDRLTTDVISGVQMESVAAIATSAIPAITKTEGFTPLRMGGATLKKTANPSNRTSDNSTIAFDVLYEDEGILSAENQGKVATIDILPYEGDEFNNPNMGDYTLTDVTFAPILKSLNIDGAPTPTLTFYYTTEAPETVKTDVGDFLIGKDLYDFSDSYWHSISIPYNNGNAMPESGVVTALNGQKITAFGWVIENAGETSQIKFHYAYDWQDKEFQKTMEKDSIVYNRAYLAGENGILQKTYSDDKSVAAISKTVIGINNNVDDNNNFDGAGIEVGDILTYRIDYLNLENETATIDIYDSVPEFTEYVDASADNGGKLETVDNAPTVHWTIENVQSLGRGFVTFKVKVLETAVDKVENQAYDIINENRYDTNIVENPLMKLTAEKSSDPVSGTKVNRGDTIKYYVTVTNNGDNTIPFTQIRDYIPEGTTYVADSVRMENTPFDKTSLAENEFVDADGKLHVYEYVSGDITWQDANSQAATKTYNGVSGHLVDIYSEEENSVVAHVLDVAGTNLVAQTLGNRMYHDDASYNAGTSNWSWFGSGIPTQSSNLDFWSAPQPNTFSQVYGSAMNNHYTNWAVGNPDCANSETWPYGDGSLAIHADGTWTDESSYHYLANGYIVEYEFSPQTAQGSCAFNTDNNYAECVGVNVGPNSKITMSFVVTVDEDCELEKVVNSALYQGYTKDPGKPGTIEKDPSKETNKVEHPLANPVLEATKNSNPVNGTLVNLGDEVEYSITIKNTGTGIAKFVPIRDYIPAGTSYVQNSVSTGGAYVEKVSTTTDEKSGNYVEWVLTNLKPNEEATVTFKIKVNETSTLDQIENIALYDHTPKDPGKPGTIEKDPSKETNKVEHPLANPVLEATKNSNPVNGTLVNLGDEVEYSITIKNTGTGIAKFVPIRDYIPAGTSYVQNSVSTGGAYVEKVSTTTDEKSGNYVEWVLTNLKPNEEATVTFKIKVNETSTLDQIENIALYDHTPKDPGKPGTIEKDPTSETNKIIHPLGEPLIEAVKSSKPEGGSIVQKGDTIEYTVTVTNNGTGIAKFVQVKDYIPEGTTYVQNSIVSPTKASGVYVATNGTGKNTNGYVEWVLTDVAVGESREVTFKVTVNQDITLDKVTNVALYESFKKDPGKPGTIEKDPTHETNKIVHPLGDPHVTVVKKSDPVSGTTVKKGQTITYCLDITNDGSAPINFVQVRDYIPLMTTYIDGSVSSVTGAAGAYVASSTDGAYVEWVIDNLGVGETRTVTFKVTVNQDAINKILNEALYDWMEEDPGTPGKITSKPSIKTNQTVHPLSTAKPTQTGNDVTIAPYVIIAGCGIALLLLIGILMVLKKKKNIKANKQ